MMRFNASFWQKKQKPYFYETFFVTLRIIRTEKHFFNHLKNKT